MVGGISGSLPALLIVGDENVEREKRHQVGLINLLGVRIMFGKDKYIWKKVSRRYSSWGIYSYIMRMAYESIDLDEEDYFNFHACFRRKRNWKSYLTNYSKSKDAEREYGIDLKLRYQKFIETNSWVCEECAMAYRERKSWKRNSKRKHQWKYK